ncbi:MAG: hypothetical protein JEZ06_07135 [Anaerolineaceae bacterium]|nr:hypothetical protein [Anaerolineaceae bacterium]
MTILQRLLEYKPFVWLRRNHALEHATLHVLGEKKLGNPMGGVSDIYGFWLFGDISTEGVMNAVEEARQRLNNGEHDLAVHPHCGTNYLVPGLFAGTAAWLGMLWTGKNWTKKLERWPFIVVMVTLVLINTRSFGPLFQKNVMTTSKLGHTKILDVTRFQNWGQQVHRVRTGE